MVFLGTMFQAFSVVTAATAFLAAAIGTWKKNNSFILLARQAVFLHLIIIIGTLVSLLLLLVNADFSVEYVVHYVNLSLPMFYRFTALWAGQAGSMLFWNFLLALFTVIAVLQTEKIKPALIGHVIYILMSVSLLFVLMANFSSDTDAFRLIHQNWQPAYQPDGRGLNPLLQHWAMVIHPPILYVGYVGFAVPFAIAMAALITRQNDRSIWKLIRRWNLFSWLFLGFGIILGALWAYEELGWGGYWGWDPVENASLMPWIVGTAVLHSLMAQEKRGIFKLWNTILIALGFFMSIFGTFITRSGLVTSVHAFPSSGLGSFFLIYMGLIVVFTGVWVFRRLDYLKPERQITRLLSREAAFLFNNVFLLVILFTVIVGTLYPTFSELMGAETTMTIGPDWYNRWVAPMGIILLFLTGVAPLLQWEGNKSNAEADKEFSKKFTLPFASAMIVFMAYLTGRAIYLTSFQGVQITSANLKILAGISFAVIAFLLVSVFRDFVQSARSRAALSGENAWLAFVALMFQNKSKFMGYSIHISLAILFFGFTGSTFDSKTQIALRTLEAVEYKGYFIELTSIEQVAVPEDYKEKGIAPLYISERTNFNIFKKNELWKSGFTEVRHYPIYNTQTESYDEQTSSEPAVFTSWSQDLYLQFAGVDQNNRAIMSVYVNPLIRWIWVGFIVNTIFLVLLLLPIGEDGYMRVGKYSFVAVPGLKKDVKA